MHHSFIDRYADLESPIHRLDPRIKVVAFFTFVLAVVVTPASSYGAFFAYFCLILAVVFLSDVPLSFIFKRSLVVIPFSLMVGLFNLFFKPPSVFINIMIKSWLSILSIVTLSSTTPFNLLLSALESLKVPHLIIDILSFMYRYIFTLIDRVMTMERARVSRSYGRFGLRQMSAVGNMLGSLFVHTYERGERIYMAMVARGFDGHAPDRTDFSTTAYDFVFLGFMMFSLLIIRLLAVA